MFLKQFLSFAFVFLRASQVNGKPFTSMSHDMEIIATCNATHSVSKDQLNRSLIEKRFENDVQQDFKCFLHCLYLNYDWVSPDGVFDYANMKSSLSESNLDPSSAKHLIHLCTEMKVSDPCERSFQFTSCFWRESEKQYSRRRRIAGSKSTVPTGNSMTYESVKPHFHLDTTECNRPDPFVSMNKSDF